MNHTHQANQTSWSFIILFIVLFVTAFFVLKASSASADPANYMKVTVHQGDTLWKIADTYDEQAKMHHSQFIHWVEQRNHVDSRRLYPGETLIIPVVNH